MALLVSDIAVVLLNDVVVGDDGLVDAVYHEATCENNEDSQDDES